MKRFLFGGVVWLLMVQFVAAISTAAVVERDWKLAGDGLLTYDDVNQREWLDLSVSSLSQFSEPRIENSLEEISSSGLFAGFTLAKRSDVLALSISAGIDPTTDSYERNELATRGLIELLSPTPPFTGTSLHSIGLVDEFSFAQFPLIPESADFRVSPGSGPTGRAGVSIFGGNDLLALGTAGLMLYRIVPEPSSVQLVALLFPTAVWCRRRDSIY